MKTITIYTDGACSGNPGPGGWGAILRYRDTEKELSGGAAETRPARLREHFQDGHAPTTQRKTNMPPVIDRNKCVGCGTCADICNSHIFVHDRAVDRVPQVRFPDECWHCDSCVIDCPKGAIALRIPLPCTLLHVNAATLHAKEHRQ